MNVAELVVIGAGGHSRVVVDAAKAAGFKLFGIIDTDYKGKKEIILDVPVIGGISSLDDIDPKKVSVIVALGDTTKRTEHYLAAQAKGFSTPSIIHPTAFISEYISIGSGVFINTATIINAGAEIGENSIINTGSIIEHEVILGKHCHICPGVKIGGHVTIGDGAFIGIGTIVINSVKIGSYAVVGAGSVIIGDVESHSTVVGVSGKKIK